MMEQKQVHTEEIKAWLKAYRDCMSEHAAQLMDQPMPTAGEELFSLYETTGNRLIYEEVYFARRKMLAVFGCLSILEGKPEYLHKLEEILEGICGEECWALPAHVERDSDPNWRIRVDLFASETGQALAEIISRLGDRLSGDVREKVRHNVFSRVLEPFINSEPPYNFWEGGDNNWNAVCCGSIGCAAIALMQEEPDRLQPLLDRLVRSLGSYIGGFSDDGACMEGLSYFVYGMTYYTGFADMLYRYTDGKTDLMDQEKCRRIALFQQKCFFPSGRTLCFSDGDSRDKYKMGLTCFLAMRYAGIKIPPAACAGGFDGDSCYRFMANLRDVLWTQEYLERVEKGTLPQRKETQEKQNCEVLPDAQWSICRGASGGGVAAKGGSNAEPHNHNDVGSFFYAAGDELLLTDLGAGEYTKEYFREGRYRILCNNSFGHNVPVIDGQGQKEGEAYACSRFEADGRGKTVISFAGAYGNDRVKELTRILAYDCASETLFVEDCLTAAELPGEAGSGAQPVPMRENLVTQFPPVVEGDTIRIEGEKYTCLITVENPEGSISREVKKHSNHKGLEENVYCIGWDVPADPAAGKRIGRFRVEKISSGAAGGNENG